MFAWRELEFLLVTFLRHISYRYSRQLIPIFMSVLLLFSCIISGCTSHSLSDPDNFKTEIPDVPISNDFTRSFNNHLKQIHDAKSANSAVNLFIDYISSRFTIPTCNQSLGTQSISLSNYLLPHLDIQKMAEIELTARTQPDHHSSYDIQSHALDYVTCSQLAKLLHSQDPLGPIITEQEISTLRNSIQKTLPDLSHNPDSPFMTPLEAQVVGWVFLTGDDGTIPTNSLKLHSSSTFLSRPHSISLTVPKFCVDMFIGITILQGIDYTVSTMTGKDIFGNKIADFEEKVYFVKVNCRHEQRTRWEQVKSYYSYQNLLDAAQFVQDDIHVVMQNPNGLASLLTPDEISVARESSHETLPPTFVDFPWETWKSQMKLGDLIFKKSTRDDVVTEFSYLTHVSILYSIKREQVFESVYSILGANIYDINENWGNDNIFFSVRRIANINQSTLSNALESAISQYKGRPYRPNLLTPNNGSRSLDSLGIIDKIRYYSHWADKRTTDGIYCSKLVWLTFKDIKNDLGQTIDLDSNATRISSTLTEKIGKPEYFLYELGLAEVDSDDNGNRVSKAFKGVSPDDIYESYHLDPAFKLETYSQSFE